MLFEIEKNQGTVCPWNKLLQVCSSDNQSKKYRPLQLKVLQVKTNKVSPLFPDGPACTLWSPHTSSHPLHTSPPSTRNNSMCGRGSMALSTLWLLFHKGCPENNNKCKFLWEKSNKFHVPINVTAYLLEKFFVIYLSPLSLLTSLVPC